MHPYCRRALAAQGLFSAVCAVAQTPTDAPAVTDASSERDRNAAIITITGTRPTSLPTVLPTTIEGISGEQMREQINATDAQDALKYLPSLLVRKRYPGDYDHAVLSTRASGTGNSARSLVYADGILLSNLLGNGASFTPRWGLVTPEEIERVDVLYGPFSASYPGNSVGAVVDYVTRMPERFEAHAALGAFGQRFRYAGTDDRFTGGQGSASLGNKHGDFAWWFNLSRQHSRSHPLVFATRAPSTAAPEADAVAVSGAVRQRNRFEQEWLLVGATNLADTTQDHAKLKLAGRFGDVRLNYTFGAWDNTVERRPEAWLRDDAGQRVEITPDNAGTAGISRAIAIDGQGYTLTAADFARTRERLTHLMHGVSLEQRNGGAFDWKLAASLYDYRRDDVRAWAPSASQPQAGRLTRLDGTGWRTLAASGTWRQMQGWTAEFGLQHDVYRLRNRVFDLAEWTQGEPTADAASRFEGRTTLTSAWAQQAVAFAGDWRAVLGLRAERWQAEDGLTTNGASAFAHPSRRDTRASPKFALGWQPTDEVALKLSTGRALRFPTVSELFQGGVDAATGALRNGDPNLLPERSQTTELSAEWSRVGADKSAGTQQLRATLFHERTHDALYSQTNTTVTPNVTNIQNVDRIRTLGMELAATAKDVGPFDFGASLTYADSVIQANTRFPASVGKLQPRVPRWRASLLGTWAATPALSATLGLRLAAHQFGTLDNSDRNGDVYQGISDFLVADARLVWRPAARWSWSVGVDNLNNATYWNFHPYPQRTWLTELRFDL
jgi:iron complex outermembrane recepter protein